MKKINILFHFILLSLLMSSCGLYDKYVSHNTIPDNIMGIESAADAPAPLSWREFFTDPLLQQLIDTALTRNTDLQSARIAVEKSQIALQMAKKAILPSLVFSPSGSIANFNGNTSKTYDVPLQVNWNPGPIGDYTNKKRAAQAVILQSQAREEAVRANLISTVAQHYCLLQLLDRQLDILTLTDSLWNASLEAQKVLWQNGRIYSTAVNQQEASCLNVKTQIVDTRRNIRSVENEICRLLAIAPQPVKRNKWGNYPFISIANSQISASLLANRPDVRMADFAMEEAFYNMQTARAAFFPSFSLSGSLGWTNSAGGIEVNPGKILSTIIGSIAQPLFARGQLKGNLALAKLTGEELQQRYVQTIVDAGNQVNEAMADCQAASEKHGYLHRQVEVLRHAYSGTHELMDNGKATYLEVITAQESLLSAQLNEAMNMYDASQAVIALYIALGGGTK